MLKNSPTSHTLRRRGFTIIELLIAMVIVAIITMIVYSTFSSVIASTETADIAAEQLYTQTFLTRHLHSNTAQINSGWQPGAAYRPMSDANNPVVQVMPESLVLFQGIDNGVEDSITFTTTTGIAGLSGLPGYMKQVTYEIVDGSDIKIPASSPYAGAASKGPVLRVTEVPLMSYGDSLGGEVLADHVNKLQQNAEELGVATPVWTFPVGGMDIQYFNGEEWVKAWDMAVEERLPWALDITFEWRPWGQEISATPDENAENQFRMVVTIPAGAGIRNAAPAYGRPIDPSLPPSPGPGTVQQDRRSNQ